MSNDDTVSSLPGRVIAGMASLQLTVIGLFILLVLTVWGTLYQAEHGLFQAQERFYMSWVFLAGGWLPLPGAQLIMLILFLNLAASFIQLTANRRLNWGYSLTHGGLILMLVAGAVTFLFGAHSSLTLLEGQGSNLSSSYSEWELSVWGATEPGDNRSVSAIDLAGLRTGRSVSFDDAGLELTVETVFENCALRRPPEGEIPADLISVSGSTALDALPRDTAPEKNRPGLVFSYTRADGSRGRVLLHPAQGLPTALEVQGQSINLALRRKLSALPATIRLLDFQKEMHPGSNKARKFSSRVSLRDGDLEREVLISMNKPMRYRGFTFYQSSYQELTDGREASTLAVVKNHGRLMPYVATFMTAIGMMVHFAGQLVLHVRKGAKAEKESS